MSVLTVLVSCGAAVVLCSCMTVTNGWRERERAQQAQQSLRHSGCDITGLGTKVNTNLVVAHFPVALFLFPTFVFFDFVRSFFILLDSLCHAEVTKLLLVCNDFTLERTHSEPLHRLAAGW